MPTTGRNRVPRAELAKPGTGAASLSGRHGPGSGRGHGGWPAGRHGSGRRPGAAGPTASPCPTCDLANLEALRDADRDDGAACPLLEALTGALDRSGRLVGDHDHQMPQPAIADTLVHLVKRDDAVVQDHDLGAVELQCTL